MDTQSLESIDEVFRNISLPAFLGSVIRVLVGFSGAIFLLMLIWSGLRWTTAGHDTKVVTAAMTTMRNAVIGIIAVAISYVLITAIIQLFGTVTSGLTAS